MYHIAFTYGSGKTLPQGSVLSDKSLLWLEDNIDFRYIQKIFAKNGKPKYVINDHVIDFYEELDGVKILSLPLFLEKEVKKFSTTQFINEIKTVDCFNFMVNKKQLNRFLLIKLVEYFQLHTRHYTFSGSDYFFDMSPIIDELNELQQQGRMLVSDQEQMHKFRHEIFSKIQTEKKFINFQGQQELPGRQIVGYGGSGPDGNVNSWKIGLDQIFQNTAVSLISESTTFNKASIVTEKTAYAVLGLTFPIWIGGYGQAASWKRAGFDIFDDVINHDYQFKPTLIERCYYAIYDNIKLLTDLEYVTKLRIQCHDRLLKTRTLLLSGRLTDYCYSEVDAWPDKIGEMIKKIIPALESKNTEYELKQAFPAHYNHFDFWRVT